MSVTLIVGIVLGVMFGGILQGSIGVGFAWVMSPMLAPELLPGTMLMLPLNAYVA